MEQNSGPSATSSPPHSPLNNMATQPKSNLPKLQRIQKSNEQKNMNKDVKTLMPKLIPKPGSSASKVTESSTESKGLVGSVTTWFPPSSTIQVGELRSPESGTMPVQRPQFVEIIGNRKYLIIPTQNVVAVSPNIASTASKKQNGPDDISTYPNVPSSARLGPEDSIVKMDTDEVVSLDPKMSIMTDTNEIGNKSKDTDPPHPSNTTSPPLNPLEHESIAESVQRRHLRHRKAKQTSDATPLNAE